MSLFLQRQSIWITSLIDAFHRNIHGSIYRTYTEVQVTYVKASVVTLGVSVSEKSLKIQQWTRLAPNKRSQASVGF